MILELNLDRSGHTILPLEESAAGEYQLHRVSRTKKVSTPYDAGFAELQDDSGNLHARVDFYLFNGDLKSLNRTPFIQNIADTIRVSYAGPGKYCVIDSLYARYPKKKWGRILLRLMEDILYQIAFVPNSILLLENQPFNVAELEFSQEGILLIGAARRAFQEATTDIQQANDKLNEIWESQGYRKNTGGIYCKSPEILPEENTEHEDKLFHDMYTSDGKWINY